MQQTVNISRSEHFDVAVVGGGTAGVFAAISAARTGADTVLIEKNSRLGGTVTSAGVNYPGLFHAWGEQIIGGPCWEVILRVIELGGATLPEITYKPKHHWMEQIRVNKLIYTKVLNDMCREAGVRILTDTMLSFAEVREDDIELLLTDKAGLRIVEARVAIDATGDANLISILGYPLEKSRIQQPATPDNRIIGYNIAEVDRDALREAWKRCRLSKKVSFDRLMYYLNCGKLDCHIESVDADQPDGKAALEIRAIDELYEYLEVLRSVKGLERIRVEYLADEVGVRESCRIIGEHIVTAKEYIEGFFYDDSVCYAFYPIDLHVEEGIEQTFLSDGTVPKIPYRALLPKGSRRVICAGRAVSSDTYANSALRVQAPCMAMGQVAGVAASLAATSGCCVADVDFEALLKRLRMLGAIVPAVENE